LSTVYGIVKQHDGFVHVYSEVGKGTTFKVYLPVSDHLAYPDDDNISDRPKGGKETILIAEDEELIRNLVATILAKAGYSILLACNGEEATQLLEEHGDAVDLAFLDVVMPRLGGLDVQNRVHEKLPRLRFLFTSGYSAAAIHTNFILNQGMHFIPKPYSFDALLKKVREVLDA